MIRKFYVYRLIDPRTGKPFYIGKGTGKRIAFHEAAARRGKIDNAPKFQMIQSIWADGLEVQREIVKGGLTSAEAFTLERQMIQEADALTNIVSGCASNEEKSRIEADSLLRRLKSFDEWLQTAGSDKIDQVRRVFGDPRSFYDKVRSTLAGTAGVQVA